VISKHRLEVALRSPLRSFLAGWRFSCPALAFGQGRSQICWLTDAPRKRGRITMAGD